ncbi:esterase FE4-like [Schistocerca serialis cubense]|uniref:esterase FE4-like n=1 Tax=Schistocerca serialis cubense TaxID=2023355 RepID=UPI00214EDCC4|nr:esterase FE4-like [Schistocerca serialis cubense]
MEKLEKRLFFEEKTKIWLFIKAKSIKTYLHLFFNVPLPLQSIFNQFLFFYIISTQLLKRFYYILHAIIDVHMPGCHCVLREAEKWLTYSTHINRNAQSNYVTIQTSLGSLRGQAEQSVSGQTMYTFKGVPYAEPPVGTLRFQPPVAKQPWDGVRDALAAGSMCVQLDTAADRGQEDCLFLNVYTPELPAETTTLRPVMVFIHGGGFVNGAGITYGPDYFVEAGVVIVTINYRLGPLGFLSTEDLVVPGNMGMKDQVQALRWVQQNIAVFGGDPNSVTIFGQSAGGASVHYLVLSPLAKGLFHKAIAESGAALNPWAFARNTRDRAYRLAQSFGYSGSNNTTEIVQFLLTVDAYQLVSNPYAALPMEDIMGIFQMVFVPSVEPQHDGAFLTAEPTELLSQGLYNDVPYMTGGTSAECLFYVALYTPLMG